MFTATEVNVDVQTLTPIVRAVLDSPSAESVK